MNFLTAAFLTAMVAAAGPTLIHLLNRRRHRTVQWAAMDFLREAVRRNKRLVEVRDLLILVLRTLAVALFVLAMAQPFFTDKTSFWTVLGGAFLAAIGLIIFFFGIERSTKGPTFAGVALGLLGAALVGWQISQPEAEARTQNYSGQPLHAILVIDNSLSMGFSPLEPQLVEARNRAKAFIETLPAGSQVSVIPLCQRRDEHVQDVYRTTQDALEAVDRLQVIDRAAYAADGAELAARAAAQPGTLPTKRVVFIGDMQASTWSTSDLKPRFDALNGAQVVHVGPSEERGNTWVSDFRLRDGIAAPDVPAVFHVTIRHQGKERRDNVDVTLTVGDHVLPSKRVDLLPDQSLLVEFDYSFRAAGTSTEPLFVPARVEISRDRLPDDDFRVTIVPVAAKVPVLFVDQHGRDESRERNVYGDTFPLRDTLAPPSADDDLGRQLIDIRQRTVNDVTQEEMKDVRLIVVAGVAEPTEAFVKLLREYVEQGGQVLIAAGGQFKPDRWDEVGWAGGAGVLPAPLRPTYVGQLAQAGDLRPKRFFISPTSVKDAMFDLGITTTERDDLLLEPYFERAVAVDEDRLLAFDDAESERQQRRLEAIKSFDENEQRWTDLERAGQLSAGDAAQREEARQAFQKLRPNWLAWTNPLAFEDTSSTIDQRVARARPVVMGRYDNGEVFAVRRRIGVGEVVFFTSGAAPAWNSMAVSNAILLFDHAMRMMLTRSLPNRTLGPVNQVVVPVPPRDQGARFSVVQPGDETEHAVSVEALGGASYGLILRDLGQRGVYEIKRHGSTETGSDANRAWSLLLALNGPSDESELVQVTENDLEDRQKLTNIRYVTGDDPITLEGATRVAHHAWRWVLFAALACLLFEMFCLTPAMTRMVTGPASRGGSVALPEGGEA